MALREGALLVDIRPPAQRAAEGTIPGAITIERNILEWRLDPSCSARLPIATDFDQWVVVFCSAGYSSSLAAASLREMGFHRATDLIDGFWAWVEAGLPADGVGAQVSVDGVPAQEHTR